MKLKLQPANNFSNYGKIIISESQNYGQFADLFGPKRSQTRFAWDD